MKHRCRSVPGAPIRKYRCSLPHWSQDDNTYFITFRLFQLPIRLEAKSTVMLEACSFHSRLWVLTFDVIDRYLEP